ncbi:protein phosphatase 2c, putative [Ichthyophthirius multifiliis]|uniref:Protein phosphatase 2c, putative n=1 Tax=Ichthyophthirius multifiliis TaxID=5932 RepID=G0QWJ2_ICHMU|nr:protein phosphatase 2c, putative [Ichthyophthirius multifiliis]EGR30405.1 protein phosphatase 2c, putative [Ichthyophthirius multifiliis]|eukprot:XP_004031992.1 protein phosphatase 2c, putative [Ichthyophthirius multifiliis]
MGAYLSEPITQKDIDYSNQSPNYEYCAASMQGWRVEMEDTHIANTDIDGQKNALFAVFDGHGGAEISKYQYKEALTQAFLKMDDLIRSQLPDAIAGCTANVILIIEKKNIYCANCGDSRTVISKGGTALPLSIDHKPDDEIELKRINNAGGQVLNGRVNGNLNLSRAIGDMDYKINEINKNCDPKDYMISAFPDVQVQEITNDINLIVMGCDGIWECKDNQYIIEYFSKQEDLQQQSQDFLDEIISKNQDGASIGMDNMTLIVIRIK